MRSSIGPARMSRPMAEKEAVFRSAAHGVAKTPSNCYLHYIRRAAGLPITGFGAAGAECLACHSFFHTMERIGAESGSSAECGAGRAPAALYGRG